MTSKAILTSMYQYSAINIGLAAGIAFLILVTAFGRHNENETILAAIKDSGCSTRPHKVIEQKDMSAIYDRSQLGGS